MKPGFRLNSGEIDSFFKNKPRPRRVSNDRFVVYSKKNSEGRIRFAVTVSRKYGKACKRNLVRRRVREIMASMIAASRVEPLDIVVSVVPSSTDRSYKAISEGLTGLFEGN